MTDKSQDRLGHFNTILATGAGNLNNPIFKSSNGRALPGVDRRIKRIEQLIETLPWEFYAFLLTLGVHVFGGNEKKSCS